MDRRKFLLLSALTSSITMARATEQHPNIPGVLEPGFPSKEVIIIGAGISGLVAAYELSKVGHRVMVLEARDRVGGRVFTLRNRFSGSQIVEAGAARIQPTHALTLGYAQHFGLRLKPFYPSSGLYVVIKDGQRIVKSAEALTQEFPSARLLEWKKIDQGFDLLPQAFAHALEGAIYLGDSVTRVEQNSFDVRVWCQSGRQYQGDYLLCTVPLPVLNKIDFHPPLSSIKQQASHGGYTYRPATRFFVEFSERFWEADGFNGWGLFNDRAEELWHPTWDNSTHSSGILHAYLKGDTALNMDSLVPEEQLALLIQRWSEALPGAETVSVEAVESYSWTTDLWAGGGWAYPSDDEENRLFAELGRKENRLYFAGDHTSNTRGWIQGALESGIRAAQDIHRDSAASNPNPFLQ